MPRLCGRVQSTVDEFVVKAEEYLHVVRPFFPVLERFLPQHGRMKAGLNEAVAG
jgi:hypothetical protein